MAYPSAIYAGTSVAGTTTVDAVDHAANHNGANSEITAIETTLGTTAGTSVLKHFAAGEFPARVTGVAAIGTLQQTIVGGTLSANLLAGQITNSGTVAGGVYGTATFTGGTVSNAQINSGTASTISLGTPTIVVGSDAAGDLYTRSSAGTLTRIASGSVNQYLKGQGVGTAPVWASGGIVQVGQTTYSTQTNNSGTAFVDSGLAGTITPASTSSKVLVMCNLPFLALNANLSAKIILLRGTTTIYTAYDNYGLPSADIRLPVPINYLDSPATTSATVYKVQFQLRTGTGTVALQADSQTSSMILMEVSS